MKKASKGSKGASIGHWVVGLLAVVALLTLLTNITLKKGKAEKACEVYSKGANAVYDAWSAFPFNIEDGLGAKKWACFVPENITRCTPWDTCEVQYHYAGKVRVD